MKGKEDSYNYGSGGSVASMKLENGKAKMQGSRFATLRLECWENYIGKIDCNGCAYIY